MARGGQPPHIRELYQIVPNLPAPKQTVPHCTKQHQNKLYRNVPHHTKLDTDWGKVGMARADQLPTHLDLHLPHFNPLLVKDLILTIYTWFGF